MSISSLSLSNFSRNTIQRVQSQLVDAQKELNTGRHADVGRTLGQLTGTSISYRAQESAAKAMQESNKVVAMRFDTIGNALSSIRTAGDDFSKAVINGTATATGISSLISSANQGLQQVLGGVNVRIGGEYLMAGTHSDVQPINSDDASVSELKNSIKSDFDVFLKAIGAVDASNNADVSKVTTEEQKAQLKQYFEKNGATVDVAGTPTKFSFDADFDARWNGTTPPNGTLATAAFVQADGQASTARISKSETIETSVSAKADAFKSTVAAYAMVGALGVDTMGAEARQVVTMAADARVKSGQSGITALQAEIGVRENRVAAANELLKKQQDIAVAAYDRLEGVDTTEASLLINQLKTQLEITYAVTGRLQGLSILNYL